MALLDFLQYIGCPNALVSDEKDYGMTTANNAIEQMLGEAIAALKDGKKVWIEIDGGPRNIRVNSASIDDSLAVFTDAEGQEHRFALTKVSVIRTGPPSDDAPTFGGAFPSFMILE